LKKNVVSSLTNSSKPVRKQAKEQRKKAEKDLEKRIETVLHSLNMPTRKDVESLNRKINALTRKIDELQKA
jgi:poly(hydroxyalkanoate) granule-associated protein